MPANPDLPFLYGHGERHGTGERRREGSKLKSSPATRSQLVLPVAGESGEGECGEDKPPSSCSLRPAGDAMDLFAETPN